MTTITGRNRERLVAVLDIGELRVFEYARHVPASLRCRLSRIGRDL
jgi:hypothetical protein